MKKKKIKCVAQVYEQAVREANRGCYLKILVKLFLEEFVHLFFSFCRAYRELGFFMEQLKAAQAMEMLKAIASFRIRDTLSAPSRLSSLF